MAGLLVIPDNNAYSQICTNGDCYPGSRVLVCLKPGYQGDKVVTLKMGVQGVIRLHERGMVDPGPCHDFATDENAEIISADILCDDPCLDEYEVCLGSCDLDSDTLELCTTDCADTNSLCIADSCNR